MAAKLTFGDVRSGRAVPQRGGTVGNYVYMGGDPADLSRYGDASEKAPMRLRKVALPERFPDCRQQ